MPGFFRPSIVSYSVIRAHFSDALISWVIVPRRELPPATTNQRGTPMALPNAAIPVDCPDSPPVAIKVPAIVNLPVTDLSFHNTRFVFLPIDFKFFDSKEWKYDLP